MVGISGLYLFPVAARGPRLIRGLKAAGITKDSVGRPGQLRPVGPCRRKNLTRQATALFR